MPRAGTIPVRAVFFDVGETLVDESTEYARWADWLGVPRHTFWAVLGAVIAQGRDHRDVFTHFRPGFDLAAERRRRADAGLPERFDAQDLYPDVRACLTECHERGLVVGLAGNQPAHAGRLLRELDLPVDVIATSAEWGAEKPSPGFYERLVAAADREPAEIAYVGDRLDNDVLPALSAGLVAIWLVRGPWAFIHRDSPQAAKAPLRVHSLTELPDVLTAVGSAHPGE